VVNSPVFNSRGDVYFALKNFGDAEADYRRALDLSPAAAEAQFNFANRLKNLGQVEAAIGHYRRAIDLKPEFGAAHFNLANTYYDTSKLENAAEHYLLALHADPALVQACINLAGVYVDMGKVDLANIYYRNAIGLKGDAADVYFDYGNSLLSADDPLGAEAAFRIASQLEPEGAGLLAGVHLAVMSYLDHDVEACEELLSRTHLIQAANEDRFRNASAYWRYLRALLPLVAAGQAASRAESVVRDAFVLGESHCLSVHGLVTRHPEGSQCWKARWIPGCKQWHLASPSPNKYKYQFERIVSKLPQAPTLLLTFGEIDCRQDEGILRVAAKKGVEHIPGIIQSTVSGYLDYVEMALKELQPRIIICGVPAPNVSGLHDGEGLIGLIREFNACLAAQVARRHWRFLDVYAVSNRGDGIADGSAHIDQFHLYPATIATAFEWL
jgi:tetratricopeptide (TPR) repeat protein